MNTSEEFQQFQLVSAVVVISWMSFVILKIYRRHKTNMEPIIILQIHLYSEFLLFTVCNLFRFLRTYRLENRLSDSGNEIYCLVNNFLNLYTLLCILCSSSILHNEKYQLLKSNYLPQINRQGAWDRIISLKIIMFFITLVGYSLDAAAQKCHRTYNPELTKNHILWFAVPYFIALYHIFNVLRCALKVKMIEEREVLRKNPTIRIDDENVPTQTNGNSKASGAKNNIESVSAKESPVHGRNCIKNTNIAHPSSHKNTITEHKEKENCVMYPNDSLDSDEDKIVVLESVFIDQSLNNPCKENLNDFESQQNEEDQEHISECEEMKDRFKIVRRGSAKDMFYRESNDEEVKQIDSEHFLTMPLLTSVVKENLQTFCIFFLYLPQLFFKAYIFALYTFFNPSQNNDAIILVYFRLFNFYSLIVTLVYFLMGLLCERT